MQVDERQGVGEGSSKGQDKKPAIVGLGGAKQEGRLDDEDHSQEGEHSEEEMLEMERFLLYALFTPYMGISKKWVMIGARLKRELAMLIGMYTIDPKKQMRVTELKMDRFHNNDQTTLHR